MYIGLDVVVYCTHKEGEKIISGAWTVNNGRDVNKTRQFFEEMAPSDFISAKVKHTDTGQETEMKSAEEVVADSYNWLAKPPREQK